MLQHSQITLGFQLLNKARFIQQDVFLFKVLTSQIKACLLQMYDTLYV